MADKIQVQVVYQTTYNRDGYKVTPVANMREAMSDILSHMDPITNDSDYDFVHVIEINVVTGETKRFKPTFENMKPELQEVSW